MIASNGNQSLRKSKQNQPSRQSTAPKQLSPLRQRMIGDMELAGFTPGTQKAYIGAVVTLQDHYGTAPGKLTEKQVQQYLFWLRDEKKVAKGTFQVHWAGIKFLYYQSLGVDWTLFTRKKVRHPLRKRLPVPIAWADGHRLIATLKRRDYQLCCAFMLALGFGQTPRTFKMLSVGHKKVALAVSIPRICCHDCGAVKQIRLPFADPKKH